MKKIILNLLFLNISYQAQALNYRELALLIHQYDELHAPRSEITFVQDEQGNKYVIKQNNTKQRDNRLASTVCELVALEIGHSVGIALNTACLIPAGVPFIGKDLNVPATLATFVEGIRFDAYRGEYSGVFIRQQNKMNEIIGLTRDIIRHIARHKDLPNMVAFDTFVGNADRSRGNYFYNEDTDTFIGIDMGSAFRRDLCKASTKNLRALMDDPAFSLNKNEHTALRAYQQMIKKLMRLYSAKDIYSKLAAYARSAGLFNNSYFTVREQKRWARYLSKCKRAIYQSHRNAQELVDTLEEILRNYTPIDNSF